MLYSQDARMLEAEQLKEKLVALLSHDLDFHNRSSSEYTHDLHAFPAKFPPQLPRKFIEALTMPGDRVLDPMAGSGTTPLEAFVTGRQPVIVDIDPLALSACRVKMSPLPLIETAETGNRVISRAKMRLSDATDDSHTLGFDSRTQEFIDYWFNAEAQRELHLLLTEIRQVRDDRMRAFLMLTLSAIIITKSGGVSLAFDLAHTRPHKVADKKYRSPLKEFEKRFRRNLRSMADLPAGRPPMVYMADAQALPLCAQTIDLVVTSPPYPSNAIDYMRAHKFSLVWLGYALDTLSQLRKAYIGSETVNGVDFEPLPDQTQQVIAAVAAQDTKKGQSVARYYSEMTRVLRELFRVLKPGKAAVMVVGSSRLRGVDTNVHGCLAEIGQSVGFEVPHIGVRRIDRNRRMMPARQQTDTNSQIEKRMHEEYVIGFFKPVEERK
jgi:DNA modification methylase